VCSPLGKSNSQMFSPPGFIDLMECS
jgi:hypothetical protein